MENIAEVSFSNSSLTISWMVPPGHVDSYIVNIFSADMNMSRDLTTSQNSTEIGDLTAGRVYNVTVTSVSGILKNISSVVSFATSELEIFTRPLSHHSHIKNNIYLYFSLGPNPPEAFQVSNRTNASIFLLWSRPLSMDGVNVSYEVSYTTNQSGTIQTTSVGSLTLTNLTSSSRYEISVVTVGVKDRRSSYVNLTTYTGVSVFLFLYINYVWLTVFV